MEGFDSMKRPDINEGVKEWAATPGAVLLDVRTPQEYQDDGRISGSKNVPLQSLEQIEAVAADKETPLFVYCYSGARSGMAVRNLEKMGYTNVKNIGGIAAYTGEVER